MVKLMRTIRVQNAQGLHVRPATAIVKLLQTVSSSVSFTRESETVNAKSIMSILMLAATQDTLLTVIVEGEDAEEAMTRLVAIFEARFGEEE